MKLSGEEKRIQALFHELKSEDDLIAPSFARTWSIAQARFNFKGSGWAGPKTFPQLPRLLTAVVIVALVVAAVVLWSGYLRPSQQPQERLAKQLPNYPGQTVNPPPEEIKNGSRITKPEKPNRLVVGPRRLKPAARALAASRLRKVKEGELSRWQSPTTELLRFPGDELLRSAPAMIQSSPELRTFLSHTN